MNTSIDYPENERPVQAICDHTALRVKLADGREIVTPLWWYPKLLNATPMERNNVRLMLDGVHWPDVDEDLSIRGMLRGWKSPRAKEPLPTEGASNG